MAFFAEGGLQMRRVSLKGGTARTIADGLRPGRDGLKQFVTMMRTAFPDTTMDVHDLIADGDKVVARLTLSGTQRGEFAGIPASGKSMSVTTIDIIRFENGLAVEPWGVTDSAKMLMQLGATAAAGST